MNRRGGTEWAFLQARLMGGPFTSGLDCMEAAQPKELSCNVTSNNNQLKKKKKMLQSLDFLERHLLCTLPRFFLLKGFSKAVLAEQGSCLELNPLGFSLFHPSSFFSLPLSLFVQEVSRIKVSLTHKAFT